ncbi:MAG: ABC transporter ATP-binding protein [Bacteroidota bacterium]
MSTTLFQITDLRVSFELPEERVEAVKGISFEIQRGEILGIVGESGSGKSVTALSILQLLALAARVEGQIVYHSAASKKIDLLKKGTNIRDYRGKKIAMIFQEPMSALNPVFKVGKQIVEAIQTQQRIDKKAAKNIALEWLEKVQLGDIERIFQSYPHQLSGGQLQRIMIAMAMSSEPDLLIADEPTTALDVQVQKAILDLLKELQAKRQTSILFISHDLAVVAALANRVLVMRYGKIVEAGTIEKVFYHPQHPYTKGLLACRPPIDKKLHRLASIEDFETAEEHLTPKLTHSDATTFSEKTTIHKEEILLHVDQLSVWFANQKNWLGRPKSYVKAVQEVSFELKRGETLALVGESGSGKTTLGRSILRLNPVRSGQVFFEGQPILETSKKEMRQWRKQMQIIFQNPYAALNPRMPIGFSIAEPMKVHGIADSKKRTLELLEIVGLKAIHFSRYPNEFSGGQRQRICIARALALQPKFIVCDECVSSLDVSVQAQILNLLKDLQEEFQLSYLFITHDLSVVRFMADRILIMKNGSIIERGTAAEIFEQAQTDYTKLLLEAIPRGV